MGVLDEPLGVALTYSSKFCSGALDGFGQSLAACIVGQFTHNAGSNNLAGGFDYIIEVWLGHAGLPHKIEIYRAERLWTSDTRKQCQCSIFVPGVLMRSHGHR